MKRQCLGSFKTPLFKNWSKLIGKRLNCILYFLSGYRNICFIHFHVFLLVSLKLTPASVPCFHLRHHLEDDSGSLPITIVNFHRSFISIYERNFFTVRTTIHWSKLPKNLVQSPSLEVFTAQLDCYIISPRLSFP